MDKVVEEKGVMDRMTAYLAKLLTDEGLKLVVTPNGVEVNGHNLGQMFSKYLGTMTRLDRLNREDYTLVSEFVDVNWALLKAPFVPPPKPEPKSSKPGVNWNQMYADFIRDINQRVEVG